MTGRGALVVAGLVLVLVATGVATVRGERTIATGRAVLLEIAPVDPRALMQGDYMFLDYEVARSASRARPRWTFVPTFVTKLETGRLILRVDERGIASFSRFAPSEEQGAGGDEGTNKLADDEILLQYRVTGEGVTVGSRAWYFQEGTADEYARARYAEYRVMPSGAAVLVGLRDGDLEPVGEPRAPW